MYRGEQLSTTLARLFLRDAEATEPATVLKGGRERLTARALGRTVRFLAREQDLTVISATMADEAGIELPAPDYEALAPVEG